MSDWDNDDLLVGGHLPDNPTTIVRDVIKGEVWYRKMDADCPVCGKPGEWNQYAEVWIEDVLGKLIPQWDECPAWHFECYECDYMTVDLYGDGTLRAYRGCLIPKRHE